MTACEKGDFRSVRRLIAAGVHVNEADWVFFIDN